MSSTKQVQQELDEAVGIMQNNVNKVMQRGEQLDQLQGKTENLQNSANQFKKRATDVRKEMWWKDMKLKLIIGGIVAVVIIIIIVAVSTSK